MEYETFKQILIHVCGQAFTAAGFSLQDNPLHNMRGLFRYRKTLESECAIYVEFQMLAYRGGPSRFHVSLLRNTGPDARVPDALNRPEDRIDIPLARLLWENFDVRQFDGPEHWWTFSDPQSLAYALFEAGKLVFAFGVPWLEGKL